MSVWETLGIESTKDVTAIKKAYAKQLRIFHPEDDPMGYQKLREAFDDAIMMSTWDDEDDDYEYEYEQNNDTDDEVEDSDVLDFGNTELLNRFFEKDQKEVVQDDKRASEESVVLMKFLESKDTFSKFEEEQKSNLDNLINALMVQVEALYGDFSKRLELENWREIFEQDHFWDLNFKKEFESHLFDFLVYHPFLPKEIYVYLKSIFFLEEASELKDSFYEENQQDFISFMLRQFSSDYFHFNDLKTLKNDNAEKYLTARENMYQKIMSKDFNGAYQEYIEARAIYSYDSELERQYKVLKNKILVSKLEKFKSIAASILKYASWKGRMRRTSFILFVIIFLMILQLAKKFQEYYSFGDGFLLIGLPFYLSAVVKRLHDSNRSGGILLGLLIPYYTGVD